MTASIVCECGNTKFWFFGHFVRCPKCFNEYKETPLKEILLRRLNMETDQYENDWEHWTEEIWSKLNVKY